MAYMWLTTLLALSDRILYISGYQFDGGYGNVDSIMTSGYCQSWPNWNPIGNGEGIMTGSATDWVPALANWGSGALAVWNGDGDDTRIWCSQYNQAQNSWSPQYLTKIYGTGQPIQSGSSPAIVNANGMLLMVWRGEGSNDNLYYSTSTDGQVWAGAGHVIPGAASTIQPALVMFNAFPVLCFKGGTNDGGIYSATYDLNGSKWSPVVHTGPFGTTCGPTLAVYQGQLFMAWKGDGSDTDIWWATTTNNLDPKAWSKQSAIPNVGTQAQPAAVVF
jgi:hypothetical protein